jgi:hypothetical protein
VKMGNIFSSCCEGDRNPLNIVRSSLTGLLLPGRPKDGLYEPILADSEREAVADLLQYLENVSHPWPPNS